MKIIIPIALLMLAVSLVHGTELDIKNAWSKEDPSPDERTALVEKSKKLPFDKIAPTLLTTLVENQPFYGINPWGDTPWNNGRLTPKDRTYLMASAVWQHHMEPRDDPAKAKTLLALLQKEEGVTGKSILIRAIMLNQWCAEAEQPLLKIATNGTETLDTRQVAVTALLKRCDLDTYIPLGMEIVNSYDKEMEKNQAFNSLTNQGNRLYKISEKNRDLLLSTGFAILIQLDDEDLQHGYFVALQLGFILKIPNEFKPDQKTEKYQGQHGLTDDFFIDTVKNALEWYSENMATNQGMDFTGKTPVD